MGTTAPVGLVTPTPTRVKLANIETTRLATVGRPVFYVHPDITVTDWGVILL